MNGLQKRNKNCMVINIQIKFIKIIMARQCTICGKKPIVARQRIKLMSKYNPTPAKRKLPNLQVFRVPTEVKGEYKKYAGKRITICAKCIKTFSK